MQQKVTSQKNFLVDVPGKLMYRLIKIFCSKRQVLDKKDRKQSMEEKLDETGPSLDTNPTKINTISCTCHWNFLTQQ
jgi:hypothetical protein